MITFRLLMKLMDLENPSEFCFANDCIMDDSGIFAKSIDKHTQDILIGDEWVTRKQFEEDIKLELPCSAEMLKLWLNKNGFDDLLEKLSRIKGIAHTKALRTFGIPYTDKQLSNNIVSANDILDSPIKEAHGELAQYTQLNIQKLILRGEQKRVQKVQYDDEATRQNRLNKLDNKIKEIDWFIDDCPNESKSTNDIYSEGGNIVTTKKGDKKKIKHLWDLEGLRSSEVTVTITEDKAIVKARGVTLTVSPADLGLRPNKTDGKKSIGWRILCSAAYRGGAIDEDVLKQFHKAGDNDKNITNNKSNIMRLKKHLKESLNLIDYPICNYSRLTASWQLKLSISDSDSSNYSMDDYSQADYD
jgi:hypothetical protein